MTEEVQHTLNVIQALNEKISTGKEILRRKKLSFILSKSIYIILFFPKIILPIFFVKPPSIRIISFKGFAWIGFYLILTASLSYITTIEIFNYLDSHDIKMGYEINDGTMCLRGIYIEPYECRLSSKTVSFFSIFRLTILPNMIILSFFMRLIYWLLTLKRWFPQIPPKKRELITLEEIKNLKGNIKKWEAEKREFLLSHEEMIKKPEENLSSESKECPMCAETIKTKAIICRFCGHKFES